MATFKITAGNGPASILIKHQNALIALSVHAFTASGIVLAMLAAFAAYRLEWTEFFMWLGVALFVDGVDGPIARKFEVERRLPSFSGAALDTVVDYVTYVFLPAFAIAFGGFLTSTTAAIVVAGTIVFTSAMYYADTRMKMKNNAFRGFPVVWNAVAFVFFVFRPDDYVVIAITMALAVLTFAPIAFIHPVRVEKWRPLNMLVALGWFVFAGIALYFELDPPASVTWGLVATSAYLSIVGAVQQLLERLSPEKSD